MRILLLCIGLMGFMFLEAQQANLYTIPNQSAEFIRHPSRYASTGADAVYFNGAALARNENGFFFSINNQILNQITEVESDYVYFKEHPTKYDGRVTGFVFPSVFLNYKINKASFHGGFFLVGGAGGVTYDNLPVSDRGIADIPAALQYAPFIGLEALDAEIRDAGNDDPMYRNITDYRFNFQNKGLGYSPAFQGGFAFEINKYFSTGFAVRYVSQRFQSDGFVKDIEINVESNNAALNGWQSPGDYLRAIGTETGNLIYTAAGATYDELGGDRFIDVQQKGSGFIPIFSFHIQPTDDLSIGIKYEPRTNVTLTTTVVEGKDGGEQGGEAVFTDGEKIRSDLPGFVAAGLRYQITDKWSASAGGRIMFIKNANFNGREEFIEKNYFEIEVATEYQLFKKFLVSGGYTYNKAGVNQNYHNEVDYWIPGHTIALGGRVDFSDHIGLNFGAMYTIFQNQSFTYNNHLFADGNPAAQEPPGYMGTYTMNYNKKAYIFALGLDFKFPNNKNKTQFIDEAAAEAMSLDVPYQFRAH